MGILEMIAQGSAPDILGNVQKGVGIGRDVMAMRAYQQEQEQAARSQKAWGSGMNNLQAAATSGKDIMPPLMELYAQDPEKAKMIQDAILSSNKERVKKFAQTLAAAGPLAFDNPKKAKEIIKQAMGQLNPQQDAPFYAGGESLLAKKEGPEFQEGMLTSLDVLSQFGFLQVEKSLSDIATELDLKKRETSTKEKNATTAAQRAEDAKKIAYANMNVATQNNIRSVRARQDANAIAKAELELKQRDAQRQAEEGKIPTDYRKTEDGGVEPIPGSPTDIKAKEIKTQKISAYKNLLSQYENVSANIDTLIGNDQQEGLIKDSTTGREGRFWSMTGDPDIEDVDGYLEMIQSNTMFDSLFELKKSGISLGNLNMNEVMSLKSKVAALNRKGNKGTLKKQLGVIKKEYERLLKNASSGLEIGFDGEGNIIE